MKVLISGSSGFIGTELNRYLTERGAEVVRLLRKHASGKNNIFWNVESEKYNLQDFEGFDTVINLSGENIFGLWTKSKKKKIVDSRLNTTSLLCKIFNQLKAPPKNFISASAIGYYGSRVDEVLDESSKMGEGFFPELSNKWEQTALKAQKYNIRVVNLRFGLVLSKSGGALSKMLTPFKLGIGGRIGDGNMYWSWISINDLLSAIEYIIEHNDIQGPVNMVSPNPVKNYEFTKILGDVLSRPTLISLPRFVIETLLGEMGREALLASTRVVPKKLHEHGFKFRNKELKSTFEEILS